MALTTVLRRGVATCQTLGSQSSSTTTGQSGCRANSSRGWRVCGAGLYAKYRSLLLVTGRRVTRSQASWRAENRWFGADRARTEYALLYAKDLHLEQPDLAGRPFLNAPAARGKEVFTSSKREIRAVPSAPLTCRQPSISASAPPSAGSQRVLAPRACDTFESLHHGGRQPQAGEAHRVFRADCKAKRAHRRSKYFFSSWTARA